MPNCGRILILGGYGATGRCLSRLLIEHCDVEVTIAGRDENRAAALASRFGSRCRFARVDAADPISLRRGMAGHCMVLLAAPGADLPAAVAEMALDVGIDYLDVVYIASKLERLRRLDARAKAQGRCLITEAGFHPGLPAAMVQWAALQCERLKSIEIAALIHPSIDAFTAMPESVEELVEGMFSTPVSEYVDGRWRLLRAWNWPYRSFDFGDRWGQQGCVPLYFDELREVQSEHPEIQRIRFLMAGLGPVTDWVVTPLLMLLQKLAGRASRQLCAEMLWRSVARFTPKPAGTVLAIRYEGEPEGGFLVLQHQDEYMFTAIPVVAYLRQWMDGSARPPGLHYMGMAAEPVRLLCDMERLGVSVSGTSVNAVVRAV